MMLAHAKAPAGDWVDGRKACGRTQLLSAQWGGANILLSCILKRKNTREKLCSICIPLFCVCTADKAYLPQPMPQRALEVGYL